MKFKFGLTFLIVLCACATQGTKRDFDQPIVLRIGNTATFPGGFDVTFTRLVSDSRCPVNVTCIQAGAAVVELTCSHDSESTPVRLSTERTADRAGVAGYRVELLSVDPAPFAPPRPASEYSVTIRVVKATV